MDIEFKPGSSYLVNNLEAVSQLRDTTPQIDLSVLSPDFTVKDVRSLLLTIAERSFGSHRLLIVPDAHQLSPIIQTTLLKTIEEPPAHLIIVVQTTNPDLLLNTVRSRLHLIMGSKLVTQHSPKFSLSDLEGSTREKALEVFRSIEQEALTAQPINGEKLQIISSAMQRLRVNCNVKLTIDWFLLRWQVVSGTE